MAHTAFTKNAFKDASTLARAASRSPESAVRGDAFVLLGESELKQKHHAAAISAFKSATDASSIEPALRYRALAGTGLAHEEQRQWSQAAKFYEEAAKSPDKALASWAQERLAAVAANGKSDAGAPKTTPKSGASPQKGTKP
jgi:tetratricopeptide (TPR) repeat protein